MSQSSQSIEEIPPFSEPKLSVWAWFMRHWESMVLASVILAMFALLLLILFPAPDQVISLQSIPLSKPVSVASPQETVDLSSEDSVDGSDALLQDAPQGHLKAKKHAHHFGPKKPKHPPITSLNNASLAQLQLLPGIGPKMAQRVIEYRKSHGAFTDPAQVMDVKGIGPKKFEKMRPFLQL